MKKGTGVLLIVSALILIAIIIVVKSYSSLVSSKDEVESKETNLNVQVTMKKEKISLFKDIIKEYISEEEFKNIEKYINDLDTSKPIDKRSIANKELSKIFNSFIKAQIDNQKLTENEKYNEIKNEIDQTEVKLEVAKKNYNDAVEKYNSKVNSFPSNIISSILGYKKVEEF